MTPTETPNRYDLPTIVPGALLLAACLLVAALSSAEAQPRERSLFQMTDLVRAVEASSPGSLDLFRPMTPAEAGKPPGSGTTPISLDLLLAGSSSQLSLPEEPAVADFTLDDVLRETDLGRLLQDSSGAPLPRVEHRFRLENGLHVQHTYDARCETGDHRLPGSQ